MLIPDDSHLLGKKSWNVYNADNIARVQRDEAAAEAKEKEEERRMQEVDAQRRLAILRGEVPPPIEDAEADNEHEIEEKRSRPQHGGHRRTRKRQGEDDKDFELRVAKEASNSRLEPSELTRKSTTSSAPITDHNGHIDLFGQDKLRQPLQKNEEAEKEKQKKKREYEDQYTMRFSNAAGRNAPQQPWYSKNNGQVEEPMKDAFGNDDANRRERDAKRIVSADPLAMMKWGSARVKVLEAERKKTQEERDEELKQLRKEEKRRERHRKRREEDGTHRERSSRHRSPRGERRPGRDDSRDKERKHRERHRDDSRDRVRKHREKHRDDERRRRRSASPHHRRRDD